LTGPLDEEPGYSVPDHRDNLVCNPAGLIGVLNERIPSLSASIVLVLLASAMVKDGRSRKCCARLETHEIIRYSSLFIHSRCGGEGNL
jgi:hypothetical protein